MKRFLRIIGLSAVFGTAATAAAPPLTTVLQPAPIAGASAGARISETFPNGTTFSAKLLTDGGYRDAVMVFTDGSRLTFDDRPHHRAVYRDAKGRRIAGAFQPARPDPAWRLPEFPSLAYRLNERGTAVVSFVIGVDGRVSDVHLRAGTGSERLDNAAVKGAQSWRYTPATVAGRPVAMSATAAVIFAAPPIVENIPSSPVAVTAAP